MLLLQILGEPEIDEGSHVPRPSVITKDKKRVKIGTPVFVYKGYDVIIDCKVVNGTSPINITWFRNGSPYPTRGNASTITITDASNGDVFKCRADNIIGFDTGKTTIYVECGKYIIHIYLYYSVLVHIYVYDMCMYVCIMYIHSFHVHQL